MIDNFISEAYQKLNKCGNLFVDSYSCTHICNKEINHYGEHKCFCDEQWPQVETTIEKGEKEWE